MWLAFACPLWSFGTPRLTPKLTIDEMPGTTYDLSGNGWMDMKLFHVWFSNHFFRYIPAVQPLLLCLDEHSSHYCPETIRLAAHEKTILFASPPNTTHICQPLDRRCFGPLKPAWKQECHQYMSDRLRKMVTKFGFSALHGPEA